MNYIYFKNNLVSKGNSLIGIIIALVIVGLIIGGLYYYFLREIPDISKDPEEPIIYPESEIEMEASFKELRDFIVCENSAQCEARFGEYFECREGHCALKEDETIFWRIYRNEEYGFEFKYPKEWEVDDHSYMPVSDINWLVAVSPEILEGSKEWPFLELRNYYTDPLPGTVIDYDEVEFSVEKVPPIGHQVIRILRDGREIYVRCALYNFQFYKLSEQEVVSLCNQMLSTFRFIKEVPERKLEHIIPEKLKEALLLAIENRYGYSGITSVSFLGEGAVESVDLNNDGEREFILTPMEVYTSDGSGRHLLAGPKNFPIYIFQKRDEGWIEIFYGYGLSMSILEDTKNGYHNIKLEHKMGADRYLIELYQWQETEIKYEPIESGEERLYWE